MAEHKRDDSGQQIRNGDTGQLSYLGEKGEFFFMRTCGKGDFKVINLINRSTFDLIDAFFSSEREARLFADKRHITFVDYSENASLASHGQER